MLRVHDYRFGHVQTLNKGKQLSLVLVRKEGADAEFDSIILYYDIHQDRFYGAKRMKDTSIPLSNLDAGRIADALEIRDIIRRYKLRTV